MIFMNNKHRVGSRTRRAQLFAASGILAAGIVAQAWNCGAQTNTNSGPSYESFRIITQNNIFDPNRSPRFGSYHPTNVSHPRVDAFALVGIMSYPKGKFAFFDGSSPDYKKVLEPGATIAGYTVKDITPQAVTLAANGKEVEMKVGTQLRKDSGNQWHMADYSEEPMDSSGTVDTGAVQQSTAPPTGSSPEMDAILKRRMEEREQELKGLK